MPFPRSSPRTTRGASQPRYARRRQPDRLKMLPSLSPKGRFDFPLKERGILSLTFPNDDRLPTRFSQLSNGSAIAPLIALQLRGPELRVRCRTLPPFAAAVAMPKTSVHEDHRSVFREDQIRHTGQIAPVKPEAVPESMRRPSDGKLRTGVLAAHSRHIPTALFLRKVIHKYLALTRHDFSVQPRASCHLTVLTHASQRVLDHASL
jgi:hypothetical protein